MGVELKPDVEDDDALGAVINVETEHLNVNKAAPAVLQLRYDSTLLEKRTVASARGATSRSCTSPTGASYHRWCRARRLATSRGARWRAWIDAANPDSSRQVGDDVIMVVLTTETSRWRVP